MLGQRSCSVGAPSRLSRCGRCKQKRLLVHASRNVILMWPPQHGLMRLIARVENASLVCNREADDDDWNAAM